MPAISWLLPHLSHYIRTYIHVSIHTTYSINWDNFQSPQHHAKPCHVDSFPIPERRDGGAPSPVYIPSIHLNCVSMRRNDDDDAESNAKAKHFIFFLSRRRRKNKKRDVFRIIVKKLGQRIIHLFCRRLNFHLKRFIFSLEDRSYIYSIRRDSSGIIFHTFTLYLSAHFPGEETFPSVGSLTQVGV